MAIIISSRILKSIYACRTDRVQFAVWIVSFRRLPTFTMEWKLTKFDEPTEYLFCSQWPVRPGDKEKKKQKLQPSAFSYLSLFLSLSLSLFICLPHGLSCSSFIYKHKYFSSLFSGRIKRKEAAPTILSLSLSLSLYVPSVISIRVADEWPPNPLYSSSCPVFSLGCTFCPAILSSK